MSKHIDVGRSGGGAPIVFKSGEPVSVICVAATYTGVTYANNGGNVQLSSAGVHGLTTSPAVGASVYVSWSGGTGINGLYKVLSVDSTTAFTIDLVYIAGLGTPSVVIANTEFVVASIPIQGLTSKSKIVIDALISFTASSNSKTIKMRANSVTLFATSITNPAYKAYRLPLYTIYNRTLGICATSGTLSPGSSSSGEVSAHQTLPSEYSLSLLCQPASANEFMRLEGYSVEVFI